MATAARRARGRGRPAGGELRRRLEARSDEIEAVALTRVRAISDPAEVPDPAYPEGLRQAVRAAIGYGIEATGRSPEEAPPIPVALLAQARIAARNAIPLDVVLRRYFAGYSLLGFFVLEEAGHAGLADGKELKRLTAAQAATFDRLLAAVGEEYARESAGLGGSTERRLAERVERLLGGEMADESDVPYDFEGWHVGVVFTGCRGAEDTLRELAHRLDCRLLLLPRPEGFHWAWLASRRRPDPVALLKALEPVLSAPGAALALGEPAEALTGWRLTHNQAAIALVAAQRSSEPFVRYADVALLTASLRDEILADSLRGLYLAPLERERDGGEGAKQTLRAYFAAARNVSATAAALGLSRTTVAGRIRTIEQNIGRPLASCVADLEVAIQLDELSVPSDPSNLSLIHDAAGQIDGALLRRTDDAIARSGAGR